MENFFTLDTSVIIAYILMGAALIFCLIKLSKKHQESETTNTYGFSKDTETDKPFKTCSKIMLISGIVSIIIICGFSVGDIYFRAKNNYDYYSSDEAYERYLEYCDDYDKVADKASEIMYDHSYAAVSGESYDYSDTEEYYINEKYSLKHLCESYEKDMEYAKNGDFSYFVDQISDNWVDIHSFEYILSFSIIIVYGILFRLFMYPTKVARRNGHDQTIAITWINALLGETVIMWIVMLIWANSKKASKAAMTAQPVGDKIKELKDLLDQGIISQEEFDNKKEELLSQM